MKFSKHTDLIYVCRLNIWLQLQMMWKWSLKTNTIESNKMATYSRVDKICSHECPSSHEHNIVSRQDWKRHSVVSDIIRILMTKRSLRNSLRPHWTANEHLQLQTMSKWFLETRVRNGQYGTNETKRNRINVFLVTIANKTLPKGFFLCE